MKSIIPLVIWDNLHSIAVLMYCHVALLAEDDLVVLIHCAIAADRAILILQIKISNDFKYKPNSITNGHRFSHICIIIEMKLFQIDVLDRCNCGLLDFRHLSAAGAILFDFCCCRISTNQ